LNCTFIVLIPRVENPQDLSNICLVLLIGCMYNVLTEVLFNGHRKLISNVIYESQSAFR